jgi:predicted CoA-binding protein
MAKNSLTSINDFLAPKRFALIGLSRDPKKFSRAVYKELMAKGFDIYPVNPNMDDVEGVKCYHNVSDLPSNVKHAVFMTPKPSTAGAVENAIQNGITYIWIQQGAETKDAIENARNNNVKMVSGTCIMMHANPSGVHKFHGALARLFGAFPKN